jgi:hypothetical protein
LKNFIIVSILSVLALAGCATQKPIQLFKNVSQAELNQDNAACQMEAQKIQEADLDLFWQGRITTEFMIERKQNQVFTLCLRARGYTDTQGNADAQAALLATKVALKEAAIEAERPLKEAKEKGFDSVADAELAEKMKVTAEEQVILRGLGVITEDDYNNLIERKNKLNYGSGGFIASGKNNGGIAIQFLSDEKEGQKVKLSPVAYRAKLDKEEAAAQAKADKEEAKAKNACAKGQQLACDAFGYTMGHCGTELWRHFMGWGGADISENCKYSLDTNVLIIVKQAVEDGVLVHVDPRMSRDNDTVFFIKTKRQYVDGAHVKNFDVMYNGIKRYTTVSGAVKTIHSFQDIGKFRN